MGLTIAGLIILVLEVWTIILVIQSTLATSAKALWIVLIILFPVIGMILWWLLHSKEA